VYPAVRLHVIGGLAVVYLMARDAWANAKFEFESILGYSFGLVIGALVAGGGWHMLRWAYNNRRTRIVLCDAGFAFEHAAGVRWFPFDGLSGVAQTTPFSETPVGDKFLRMRRGPRPPASDKAGRPLMDVHTKILVQAADGAECLLTSNLVRKHTRLARWIYDKTRPYNVPWTLTTK